MKKKDWNPDAYLDFADQRLRPAVELIARIGGAPRHVVDLGCGAGGPTRCLARRWPDAQILAVDRSPAMLDEARREAASDEALQASRAIEDAGAIEWRQGDVASWRPDPSAPPPDLIFSNACLHWLPDHDALFPRLLSHAAPGGTLAVQMPLSWPQPSHRLMREVLADLDLSESVPSLARRPVDEPEVYVRRLRDHAAALDVWTTTYQQILTGSDPVYRFVESTGLRPVRAALDSGAWSRFETEYRHRLRQAYPAESDGSTHFPFRRLFVVARAPS